MIVAEYFQIDLNKVENERQACVRAFQQWLLGHGR